MSFSGDIKNEIAHSFPDDYHCLLAEAAAIIRYAGTVCGNAERGVITVETESVALAKRYLRLIRKAFAVEVGLDIKRYPSGKSHFYRVVLSSPTQKDASSMGRKETGVGDKFGRVWRETADWGQPDFGRCLLEYACCRRAFIRGAFLASGSMSDPGKSYHFEIVCGERQEADGLCRLVGTFDIHPKVMERKHKFIVYVKDSESIADMLHVIGAPNALMRLENVRIIKDMKNSANRQYNCDFANIDKVVRTAARQIEDIRLIQARIGFTNLKPALRDTARARLEHPEESLRELGTYLDPSVGKSGVNHRLKKLSEIAEALRQEECQEWEK